MADPVMCLGMAEDGKKMPILETLPYDIQYLFLESIPDYSTLITLVQASRVYYNIFKKYKDALVQRMMFNEASVYKSESYLLAVLGDQLTHGSITTAELDNLFSCYQNSISTTSYSTPWYYDKVAEGGRELRAKIALNHRGIKEHCEQFLLRERRAKMTLHYDAFDEVKATEPPATESERKRVMQGLYKIWLLLKLQCVRISDQEAARSSAYRNVGTVTYPVRHDVARYLNLWDFWDLKVVQVLLPIFWNDLKGAVDGYGTTFRLRKALCRCSGGPCDENLVYFTLFLNTTLHLHFPHTGLKYLNRHTNDAEVDQHIRIVAKYLADDERRAHFDKLGDFTGIAYIYFQKLFGSNENDYPGVEVFESIPVKRICRPKSRNYWMQGEQGREMFFRSLNHGSLRWSDIQSCMWDDWRLRSWGYCFPEFEESPCGSLAQDVSEMAINDTEGFREYET